MTVPPNEPTPDLPRVFRGLNELSASTWAFAPLIYLFPAIIAQSFTLVAALLGANLVVALGNRYRCEVNATGIILTRQVLFFWPIERREYKLDANFELYEAWESTRPEGVFIATSGTPEPESDVFGPYFSLERQTRLCEQLSAVLHQARSLSPQPSSTLHSTPLTPHADALQITAWCFDGRPKAARSTQTFELFGVKIPVDSLLHFDEGYFGRWRDPRREDILNAIDCAEATELPWGLQIQKGARLIFREHYKIVGVQGGFDAPIKLEERRVDGQQAIFFDRDGKMVEYTLAEPVTIPRVGVLPPGSTVVHDPSAPWEKTSLVRIAGPTDIQGLSYQAGDTLWLRKPWHISRWTFGLWRPQIELESLRVDPVFHDVTKARKKDL
ncbi:hypothetical protein [Bradymonas sediminis]|uniref:Uncharacterized protein n=1 Tax=Bradymonas sediminis TaxID=1548548 RepID=A0A2Z4FH10_9DELT|nr:hypothetical protein [Bradymonas sediminis]AWV88291.1 hypothetical protein DN745_02620 [Bradymonas sediminis]TDP77414.1 hypothetical protein DFR33_101316 [Bradymonas sediminis]